MTYTLVKREVVTCDRCAFNNILEASEDRVFALDDRYYELNLCKKHAEMFDRDLGGWTRLAAEIDSPYTETSGAGRPKSEYFNEQRRAETRRLRELTERIHERERIEREAAERAKEYDEEARLERLVNEDPAEAEARRAAEELTARKAIPGAYKWILSRHAIERLELRGFTITDVLLTASRPHVVTADPRNEDRDVVLHERDGCRVVLNVRNNVILTVIDRNKRVDPSPEIETERQAHG